MAFATCSQFNELNKNQDRIEQQVNNILTELKNKEDKDTTYTAGDGLLLIGTQFSVDFSSFAGVPVFDMTNLNSHTGSLLHGVGDIKNTSFGVMKFSNLKTSPQGAGRLPDGYPAPDNGNGYADGIGFFLRTGGDFVQVVIVDDVWYWRSNDGAFANLNTEYKDSYESEWSDWKTFGSGNNTEVIKYLAGRGISISNTNEISATSLYKSLVGIHVQPIQLNYPETWASKAGSKLNSQKLPFRIQVGSDNQMTLKDVQVGFSIEEGNASIIGVEAYGSYLEYPNLPKFSDSKVTLNSYELIPNIPFVLDVLVEVDTSNLNVGDVIKIKPAILSKDFEIGQAGNSGVPFEVVGFTRALNFDIQKV